MIIVYLVALMYLYFRCRHAHDLLCLCTEYFTRYVTADVNLIILLLSYKLRLTASNYLINLPFFFFYIDSISGVDCLTLQVGSPHICCEQDTGNFCERQCNNGFCQCVNPITGEPTIDIRFPENDESIDCSQSMLYISMY